MIYTIITSKSAEDVLKKWKKSNPKLFKKILQQLAANSESSIYEDFLLHVPTIYREISQQVADQLEKKDFSP